MPLGRKQAKFYCIYSPVKPEQNGILSHVKLPISWSRVKGSSGYITEETVEELAGMLISKLQSNLVVALLANCGGDFGSFVVGALKLIYGSIDFSLVKKD